jgi:uncharacterized DUF497 family protein
VGYLYLRLSIRRATMAWTWDPHKDTVNRSKHRPPRSIGEVALADPLSLSRMIRTLTQPMEYYLQAGNVVLFIVPTRPQADDVPGRIISVRKLTRPERRRRSARPR